MRCHKPLRSAHEGYAVILEELDELWEEIKRKDRDKKRMRAEAVQVAAMATRFLIDVCDIAWAQQPRSLKEENLRKMVEYAELAYEEAVKNVEKYDDNVRKLIACMPVLLDAVATIPEENAGRAGH